MSEERKKTDGVPSGSGPSVPLSRGRARKQIQHWKAQLKSKAGELITLKLEKGGGGHSKTSLRD